MNNTLKLLGALTVFSAVPAVAQQSGSVADSIGAADVTAMLSEYSIATELRAGSSGGSPSLIATTAGGAKFLIGFFECADATKPAGCKQVMISTAQASGGVDFEDLNTFNGQSSVTTVVYEPTNQILIFGRNIFMPGGVGRENFKLQVALFLGDMQKFVESRRNTAKSVAFTETPKLKSKITSITVDAGEAPVRAFAISDDRSAEVELAIVNSLDLDFSPAKN